MTGRLRFNEDFECWPSAIWFRRHFMTCFCLRSANEITFSVHLSRLSGPIVTETMLTKLLLLGTAQSAYRFSPQVIRISDWVVVHHSPALLWAGHWCWDLSPIVFHDWQSDKKAIKHNYTLLHIISVHCRFPNFAATLASLGTCIPRRGVGQRHFFRRTWLLSLSGAGWIRGFLDSHPLNQLCVCVRVICDHVSFSGTAVQCGK